MSTWGRNRVSGSVEALVGDLLDEGGTPEARGHREQHLSDALGVGTVEAAVLHEGRGELVELVGRRHVVVVHDGEHDDQGTATVCRSPRFGDRHSAGQTGALAWLLAAPRAFGRGRNVGNQVVVGLGPTQGCAFPEEVETISIYNAAGRVHVIVDVFGIFTGATTTIFDESLS